MEIDHENRRNHLPDPRRRDVHLVGVDIEHGEQFLRSIAGIRLRRVHGGFAAVGGAVMSNHPATWSISLDTECPECQKGFDLTDQDSFRESGINPLERTTGYEATCPECKHEFLVDLEF
jgi:hypothetical protein